MPAKVIAAACVAASLLLAPAVAVADDEGSEAERKQALRSFNLVTVGFAVGSGDIADVGGTIIGLHLDAGHTFGDLHLQGEYLLGGFSETAATYDESSLNRGAIVQRVGALARYHLFNRLLSDKFRFQVWVEGGFAREFWQWTEGGKLDRDLYTFGFGTGFLGNVARYGKRPRWFGVFYDFRFSIAEDPYKPKHDALVCAGPCEEPTGPIPIDFMFTFVLGLNFGK